MGPGRDQPQLARQSTHSSQLLSSGGATVNASCGLPLRSTSSRTVLGWLGSWAVLMVDVGQLDRVQACSAEPRST